MRWQRARLSMGVRKTTLKDYNDEIVELKTQARIAPNLPEKLEIQKKSANLIRREPTPSINTMLQLVR